MSDRLKQINKAIKDLEETNREVSKRCAEELDKLDPNSKEYNEYLRFMGDSETARSIMLSNLRAEREEVIEHEKEILDRSSITIPLEEYNRLQNELRAYKGTEKVISQIAREIVQNFDERLLENLDIRTSFNVESIALMIQVRPKDFI